MRVVAISDLHGYLPKVNTIPECDVVCICGDIVPLEYQDSFVKSLSWFCLEFIPWSDVLKCKKILFIGGNHDRFLEILSKKDNDLRKASHVLKDLLPGTNKSKHKLVYLMDNSIEIDNRLFYGTPWITDLKDWAFYGDNKFLTEQWDHIPKRVDVLLTHQPTKFADEGTVLEGSIPGLYNYGSKILTDKLKERNIKYTFCGHVHSGDHNEFEYKEGCKVVNVSIKDENYQPKYLNFKVYEI